MTFVGFFQSYASNSSNEPDDLESLTVALYTLRLDDPNDENLKRYEETLKVLHTNEGYEKYFPKNQFSPQDHVNIFHILFHSEHVNENLLTRIFQYHIIYNSMFPSCYESDDIKNILKENNVLSIAVENFKNIDNKELKGLCKSIDKMYETDYFTAYYDLDQNQQKFHLDWISFAQELKNLIPEKISVLTAFISYLPEKMSIVCPLTAFQYFKTRFDDIYHLDDYEKIGRIFDEQDILEDPLSLLYKIIKDNQPQMNNVEESDNYEEFRSHLLMLRDDKNLTQEEIARMLDVSASTVSRFIRGVISKSPTMLTNFRNKVVYPEFKYKKYTD